jgi:hypothetical protein
MSAITKLRARAGERNRLGQLEKSPYQLRSGLSGCGICRLEEQTGRTPSGEVIYELRRASVHNLQLNDMYCRVVLVFSNPAFAPTRLQTSSFQLSASVRSDDLLDCAIGPDHPSASSATKKVDIGDVTYQRRTIAGLLVHGTGRQLSGVANMKICWTAPLDQRASSLTPVRRAGTMTAPKQDRRRLSRETKSNEHVRARIDAPHAGVQSSGTSETAATSAITRRPPMPPLSSPGGRPER